MILVSSATSIEETGCIGIPRDGVAVAETEVEVEEVASILEKETSFADAKDAEAAVITSYFLLSKTLSPITEEVVEEEGLLLLLLLSFNKLLVLTLLLFLL